MGILLLVVLFSTSAIITVWALITIQKRRRRQEKPIVIDIPKTVEGQEQLEGEEHTQEAKKLVRKRVKKKVLKLGKSEKKHMVVKREDKNTEEGSQQKAKSEDIGKPPPPENRGGRPRGFIKHHDINQTPKIKSRSPRLEIVCWNEQWNWILGIEVPEELDFLSLTQNGIPLEQANIDEPLYRLRSVQDTVRFTSEEGEKDIPLMEMGKKYLIFKMRKNWKGMGRLVRCLTTGYYLVIVPQEWERDEEVSGSAPTENVQQGEYKAHFFYLDQKEKKIGFITKDGERIQIKVEGPNFQLVGSEIPDASEDMGPLFHEQPPLISAIDDRGWNDVGVIIVGEEGSGRKRWRTYFVPKIDEKQQRMPGEIMDRGGGWYFVRIYDKKNNLLESMDFRFMTELKNITINFDRVPSPKGYDDMTIEFLHSANTKVELLDENKEALDIKHENERTIVTIPPKPNLDKTVWLVWNNNAEIKVTMLAERIWWALGIMGGVPANWIDKLIILSREYFTATSDNALFVRLPRQRWVRKIDVGFEHSTMRPFKVEVEKNKIAIPLRDFCDTREIENRQKECSMMIWVQAEGAELHKIVVAKVPPDQLSTVKQKNKKGDKVIPEKEKISLVRPIVKCPGRHHRGKRRNGRGFSRTELTEAAITKREAKRLNIAYDKRRKTSHPWNVEFLKKLIENYKHAYGEV